MSLFISRNRIVFILAIIINYSCVEEINLITETEFESVLVVEATITNELKQQEILLSRSFRLEAEGPSPESNASVKILDNNGNTHSFQETELGIYLSLNEFAAQPDIDYHLEIITSSGKMYGSSIKQLSAPTTMDDLYVERGFNENNDEGISVFVDAFDPTGNSKYYRFEYEETYKVIAPFYSPLELIVLNDDFPYPAGFFDFFELQEVIDFFIERKLRDEQEQVCYNTVLSNTIILANTVDFSEDRLDKFRIRFVNRNNYIISHRYSILVRQYVQSQEAYIFYKTLKEFSELGSLLSQTQPGFLEGNVFSLNNQQENVVGFFEVSSVDEQRVYFNYSDLFPGDILPPYYISCNNFFSPEFLTEDFAHETIGSPLLDALSTGWLFFDVTEDPNPNPFEVMPFTLVFGPCGDCTILGKNVVPDFWED